MPPTRPQTPAPCIADQLVSALGPDAVATPAEADLSRHLSDYANEAPAGVRLLAAVYARGTGDVSRTLAICNDAGVAVVPQGGMTGLVAGSVPQQSCVVLSLERMREIEAVDAAAATMTVQAGVALERVQSIAEEHDLFFPLDLGARGSAQIGGNAATNAGGNRVLRYGSMRELVLGVEAVLADGTVITSLSTMLKNNAGYDVKQLFLGTEGTLGVITRLVLRLFPKPHSVATGLCAVADYPAMLELLKRCKAGLGATLSGFEVMWEDFYLLGTRGLGREPPLDSGHALYVLIETLGTEPETDSARFESVIAGAIDAGVVVDATVAQSLREADNLWAIRDCPGEFPRVFWPQANFDVSIPIGEIGAFVEACRDRLHERWPGIRTLFFGHLADSNLHISVKLEPDRFSHEQLDEAVYARVGEWGGSISAEHGIGSLKRPYLHHSRTPAELALMRRLKHALDPQGILNPGKVV